jgi:glycerol kinase
VRFNNFLQPGWVEQDPWNYSRLHYGSLTGHTKSRNLYSQGERNRYYRQRETTIVWDRRTGTPATNAIVVAIWKCSVLRGFKIRGWHLPFKKTGLDYRRLFFCN